MFPPYPAALLLVLLQAAPADQAPSSSAVLRQELLNRLNVERAAAGVPPLRLAEPLDRVAQENAEELRETEGAVYDEKAIPKIQRRLRRAGYQAHGWHQEFAAGPDEPAALVTWLKEKYPEAFPSILDGDYQELGIGISELRATPLYTFFLAWRESESFARQTAALVNSEQVHAEMLAR